MKIFVLLFLMASCSTMRNSSPFPGFVLNGDVDSADSESKHFQNNENQHIFYSLIMKDLNPSEAGRLLQNRKNYLKSLYQNDRDPYFSKTGRSEECMKNLDLEGIAVHDRQFESLTFNLPSTDNFVLGQCNPALESFVAQISFIYCGQKKSFYELKYYRSKNSPAMLQTNLMSLCKDD